VVHQDLVVPLVPITPLQEQQVLRVFQRGVQGLKEPKGFRTSVYKEPKVLLVLLVQVPQVLQGFKVLKELQG
jgi:hypothetical protein